MTPEPTVVTPPRRRRWLLRLGLALLVFLGLVWFTPAIIANTALKDMIVKRATAKLNGTATVNSMSLSWLSPIVLEDVTVVGSGEPMAKVAKVTSSKSLLQLALNQLDLGTFNVDGVKLTVEVTPGKTTNVEELIANYMQPSDAPSSSRPAIQLNVTDAEITLQEKSKSETKVLQLRSAYVAIPSLSAEPIAVEAVVSGAGEAKLELSLGEAISGKASCQGFQLGAVELLLRRAVADAGMQGELTANAEVSYRGEECSITGKFDLKQFEHSGPWLQGDKLKLVQSTLPLKATWKPGALLIEEAELSCDVGTASAKGLIPITGDFDKLIGQSGLNAKLEVDLAKLGMMFPKLVKLKPGTALQEGRVSIGLESKAATQGTTWVGSIQTTSLKGLREGKPLVWDQPLKLDFTGQLQSNGWPVFELLTCQSDFIGLAAKGSVEEFTARANIFLDRLSTHLEEFIDLGGLKLEGTAELALDTEKLKAGGHSLTANGKLSNVVVSDAKGPLLREAELLLELKGTGEFQVDKPVKLLTASGSIRAAGDELRLTLQEPIPDLRKLEAGRATATLSGELAQWRNRLGSLVSIPREWQLAGQASITATVSANQGRVLAEPAQAHIKNAVFRGAGIDLQEPMLQLQARGEWNRTAGAGLLENVQILADNLDMKSQKIDFKQTPTGFNIAGSATVQGQLHKIQKLLQMQSDPKGADTLSGLTRGKIHFELGTVTSFTSDLTVERFSYGIPQKPLWLEPLISLSAKGELDPKTDQFNLQSARIERDGLRVDATGTLKQFSTLQELEMNGKLNYDLSKLEPQLRPFLGQGSEIRGLDSKPFQLRGTLGQAMKKPVPGVKQLTAKPSGESTLNRITAEAGLGWQSVKAYGFEVGPAQMQATMNNGLVRTTPIEATFGGGKVRVEPTVNLLSANYDLTMKPGRIIERAKLTPAACANALGYALPAIANAAQADGNISFELENNLIPLIDPTQATIAGKLQIHNATVSAGPLMSQLVTLLGAPDAKMQLSGEQTVPIRMDKGRVYHDNLLLRIGGTEVRSSGSVGVDGTMTLVLEMPMPKRFFESALAKYPKAQETALKQRVKVPVTGTLNRPQLDSKAVEAASAQFVQTLLKSATDDLLQKGKDRLLDEIFKKANLPKK
jgi:translocation and assembly module TamB